MSHLRCGTGKTRVDARGLKKEHACVKKKHASYELWVQECLQRTEGPPHLRPRGWCRLSFLHFFQPPSFAFTFFPSFLPVT